MTDSFQQLGDIFKNRQPRIKPPAHPWQELALEIIKDLHVPNFKRSAVFKVCKENTPEQIRLALNDTKELCPSGQSWKYFFKIVGTIGQDRARKPE